MLKEYKEIIDITLKEYFESLPKNTLTKSMGYSVNLGGKRLRPALVLLTTKVFGGKLEEALPMAMAMEMIHTYSLIHDDLPAMDNDDLRRNMPTNHKVFGEAMAILAGDALLNEAMTLLFRTYGTKSLKGAQAAVTISECSGREGMILGQMLDLENENKKATAAELMACHEEKTGKLIAASLEAPALYFGATDEEVKKLRDFGLKLGLAFQIQDDILDETSSQEVLGKTIGKDEKSGKTTYVSLFGLEKSKEMAKQITKEAIELLENIQRDTKELEEITVKLLTRNH
ncbi:MAG: polyprenyl synthetase family protein [Clostridium sp.]|nr:polyprenyl synthetase family protein [Clostridium sp.]